MDYTAILRVPRKETIENFEICEHCFWHAWLNQSEYWFEILLKQCRKVFTLCILIIWYFCFWITWVLLNNNFFFYPSFFQLEKLSDIQCTPESQLKFIIDAWLQVNPTLIVSDVQGLWLFFLRIPCNLDRCRMHFYGLIRKSYSFH